jgi:hypothetical protein
MESGYLNPAIQVCLSETRNTDEFSPIKVRRNSLRAAQLISDTPHELLQDSPRT